MRRPTRREAVLAGALIILVAVLLLWFPGCGPVGRSTGATGEGSISSPSPFTISGDVSRAMAPGERVALDLTLENNNDLHLVIDRITVAVVRVDAPKADADHPCTAADFEVRQVPSGVDLRLAGNSRDNLSGLHVPRENWPAVGMVNRPVNQDGCKGASLTLGYEASGTQVQR